VQKHQRQISPKKLEGGREGSPAEGLKHKTRGRGEKVRGHQPLQAGGTAEKARGSQCREEMINSLSKPNRGGGKVGKKFSDMDPRCRMVGEKTPKKS